MSIMVWFSTIGLGLERAPRMVDRASLLASCGASCSLELPHSPGPRGSSTTRHDTETEDSQDAATLEDQTKTSLLDWLRVETRSKFKGLMKEHKDSLGALQAKPAQPKRPRKSSPHYSPHEPKKPKDSYRHHSPLLDRFSSDSRGRGTVR